MLLVRESACWCENPFSHPLSRESFPAGPAIAGLILVVMAAEVLKSRQELTLGFIWGELGGMKRSILEHLEHPWLLTN